MTFFDGKEMLAVSKSYKFNFQNYFLTALSLTAFLVHSFSFVLLWLQSYVCIIVRIGRMHIYVMNVKIADHSSKYKSDKLQILLQNEQVTSKYGRIFA